MEKGTDKTRKPHHGRNVTRLREIRDMKQETLASLLGLTQQAVSKIEQSETIDEERLEEISKILNFSPEVIKNLNDELIINYIQNNYEGTYNNNSGHITIQHPIDKIMDLYEEVKKLHEEKTKLYEALLKSEREKMALLERLLESKK